MLFQLAEATLFNFPTDLQGWLFEVIGIVASLFVFVSFFWSNEKLTRIINMVGCTVFVIYAILIGSLSVMIMNAACLVLHVVKLVQMYNRAKKAKEEKQEQTTEEKQSDEKDVSADSSDKE